MSRKMRFILAALLAVMLIATVGCGSKANSSTSDKLKVVASVYPVYEFVRQVGGDKVEATMLVPAGAEPHDWEPKAKDLAQIKSAKLFFYHGAGLEPLDKILTKEVLGATLPVEVSKGITVIAEKDSDGHANDKSHNHNQESDAHMWLDPVYAQQEVETILGALIAADPANADYYKQNAERFKGQLAKINEDYQGVLSKVTRRDIVTSHAAFGYLAQRYQLRQVAIMGLSPDSEPTPEKMTEVVKFCRENNVNYIFFETIVSPKLAQTIAKETGTELLVLNPLESLTEDEVKQGKNYVTVMGENLKNLQKALGE